MAPLSLSDSPLLRVKLAEGTLLTYTNPPAWRCIKFSTCSYWHRTEIVYWKNLASNQYASFFESDKCVAEVLYHYISDLKHPAGGSQYLREKREIRSMMVGQSLEDYDYKKPTITYVDNCPNDKEDAMMNETSVFGSRDSDDGFRSVEGLSSNWTDTI